MDSQYKHSVYGSTPLILTRVVELKGLVVANAVTVVGTTVAEAAVVAAAPLEGKAEEAHESASASPP